MATVKKDSARKRTPYVVRWRDESGRQCKRGFARKVDADRYRAEVEHKLHTGSYVDPVAGRRTFRDYAEAWRLAQPHRPNTAANTRSRLEKHIYPVIDDRPIAGIRPTEVQALVSGLKVSASSVRPIVGTLKAIFSAAVRDRVIGLNPAERITLPEQPRNRVVPLTVEQVEAIVAALPKRYRALAVVGAGTGLRQGELFGLQVADVDFLRRTLTVRRQVQETPGHGVYVSQLKTPRSYRVIPIGDVVVSALAEHLREYPAQGEQHIFTTEAGEIIGRTRFNRDVWAPARKAADVTGGTHGLRHFYASALIRAGLSVRVVSERLGHSSAAMTLNVYAHLWPDDEDRSRAAIDDVFRREVPTMRPREAKI
jgi:integrase